MTPDHLDIANSSFYPDQQKCHYVLRRKNARDKPAIQYQRKSCSFRNRWQNEWKSRNSNCGILDKVSYCQQFSQVGYWNLKENLLQYCIRCENCISFKSFKKQRKILHKDRNSVLWIREVREELNVNEVKHCKFMFVSNNFWLRTCESELKGVKY